MNEITNLTTETAADLAAQLADGTAEVIEVKGTGVKGKLITGGIALGAVAGSGILGFLLGKRHEKKKWESYEEEDDEEFDDFDDEDFIGSRNRTY